MASTEGRETALTDAGISLADGSGVIGGVTGALLADCYQEDIPASVLIVRTNPYIPDPRAARALIEDALEPLVEFDTDTQELLQTTPSFIYQANNWLTNVFAHDSLTPI